MPIIRLDEFGSHGQSAGDGEAGADDGIKEDVSQPVLDSSCEPPLVSDCLNA